MFDFFYILTIKASKTFRSLWRNVSFKGQNNEEQLFTFLHLFKKNIKGKNLREKEGTV